MIPNSKISHVRHLPSALSRVGSLATIFKSLMRSHVDCGDVVYDRVFNELFQQSLQSLQYSAAITIKGAITGLSSEKIFQELGLESL